VRLIVGPLCDQYGPRLVFAGILLAGSIPTILAGTVTTATGLTTLRFFIGILGGSFVPCQVWSTGFFDTSVIGTANGLIAGIGNSGGGITYFVLPAVFDSLVKTHNLTPHIAWRVAFVVPFILISLTALAMILLCEDTPNGPWAERDQQILESASIISSCEPNGCNRTVSQRNTDTESRKVPDTNSLLMGETVKPPTLTACISVVFSLQCLLLAASYACSFGGELAINSILGAYYAKNLPYLGQTKSAQWYDTLNN
jgi:NNP family nitrate/nitrite transporter-like MFS transporter